MRAVFLGTPEAAVPSLTALARVADVATVITQPDRPKGRSKRPMPPPVKQQAAELGIPVEQPATSRDIGPIMSGLGPIDVAVIVAFGMLIRPEALDLPAMGFVNVHFSILPRWRGAAPVQRAIEAGDPRTGITLMRLDEGLDTGPVYSVRSTAKLTRSCSSIEWTWPAPWWQLRAGRRPLGFSLDCPIGSVRSTALIIRAWARRVG